ncbi:disease resistance protein RUN1-like [Hibiscus syriacus]|uniref:disease resistance protein RUN1-like n=1 Tax=Hibiscus syriacus TaxID=106335 RepID=UPI0019239207|nr:disease resistance protein RUN1-like [Hibiscus syriacus]
MEELNNKKVFVVLDDVSDPGHTDFLGVRHFGCGSKIILTSRDRQVLKNGGADKIHEVDKLNKNDCLQLFSTIAFKQSNPVADFRDLSNKFVEQAQGSPLALKVLGSKMYTKSKREWEDEVTKLKGYAEPKFSQILKSSFEGLDELVGVSGINNLVDKCLLNTLHSYYINMHDMLEEMGKDIVRRQSRDPGQRSRLWISKDGTDLIVVIKLYMTQNDNLHLCSTIFEKMHNLKYILFGVPHHMRDSWKEKLRVDGVDNVSLPEELRCLCWDFYPFKSLPSSFNPKNLVVLRLQHGNMEQLWNEDGHLDLVNLRGLDLLYCKKLRKIPSLARAINLKNLYLQGCESLIELPCFNHLSSLDWQWFKLEECYSLSKFPELPNNFNSRVKYVSSNISKLKSLHWLDLSHCPVTEYAEISRSLTELDLSGTRIIEVDLSVYSLSDLRFLHMSSSSIQKLECNVSLSGSVEVDVSSPIMRCKSLGSLAVDHCESLIRASTVSMVIGCTWLHIVRKYRPRDEVNRWKAAFAEAGKLKGSETEYINDIVEYVLNKLMNSYSGSASEEFIGIDCQKKKILELIKQKDSRVIGLWGMGGIGKTTLAELFIWKSLARLKVVTFFKMLERK